MSQNSMEILLEYFNKMLHDPDTQPPDLSAMGDFHHRISEKLSALYRSGSMSFGPIPKNLPSEISPPPVRQRTTLCV